MFNLKNKSFLRLTHFTKQELRFLIDLAHELKKAKYSGTEKPLLNGKNMALIFEKDSTRTRCAFEVACFDQGAHCTYLGSTGSQIGKKESIADTARVLGRMYDAIQFRGFSQQAVEDLAKYANVPVYNGLTDLAHPTQVLADFMTAEEHGKDLKKMKFTYVGDGRNNVAISLMEGAAIFGIDFRIAAPKYLHPDIETLKSIKTIALNSGAKITITDDINQAVDNTDVIYTDVWVSMGENNQWQERIEMLTPYQVNDTMLKKAAKDVLFMHCLPAFHDTSTIVGNKIYNEYGLDAMEVTNEVFEGKHSVVFDEAENRLHTIKALMVATLA